MNTTTSPLSYLPTLQQDPMQGSNLPMILKSLAQQNSDKNNPLVPNNPNNNWANSFGQNFSQAMGSDPGSASMYGGYNYANMAPGTGLTGADLAQAAQTGVQQGGLTFDPTTGTVS